MCLPADLPCRLDNQAIADGEVGATTLAIDEVLHNDRVNFEHSGQHIPVPYAYLVGLMDQLT